MRLRFKNIGERLKSRIIKFRDDWEDMNTLTSKKVENRIYRLDKHAHEIMREYFGFSEKLKDKSLSSEMYDEDVKRFVNILFDDMSDAVDNLKILNFAVRDALDIKLEDDVFFDQSIFKRFGNCYVDALKFIQSVQIANNIEKLDNMDEKYRVVDTDNLLDFYTGVVQILDEYASILNRLKFSVHEIASTDSFLALDIKEELESSKGQEAEYDPWNFLDINF